MHTCKFISLRTKYERERFGSRCVVVVVAVIEIDSECLYTAYAPMCHGLLCACLWVCVNGIFNMNILNWFNETLSANEEKQMKNMLLFFPPASLAHRWTCVANMHTCTVPVQSASSRVAVAGCCCSFRVAQIDFALTLHVVDISHIYVFGLHLFYQSFCAKQQQPPTQPLTDVNLAAEHA